MKEKLISSINRHQSLIGVIGLGYVGLPLALRFSEAGYRVLGFDVDPAKAQSIAQGLSYFSHIPNSLIDAAVKCGLRSTTDLGKIGKCDAIIICLPTPLGSHREPDLSFVLSTMESLKSYLRPGQVICLESTTYPGTTEEEIVPRVEQVGLRVGRDIFVVYSPEREDPGNPLYSTRTIPKVVGGVTLGCLEVGEALYNQVIDEVVSVSSARAAEMTKLLENIHRAVNIGLVNELKIVTDKMDIDIFEVINAAATKPFGYTPYYPGPGLGGHCIPIDPFYLTWKAREFGVNTRFIELAGEVNTAMPSWVVSKVEQALNRRGKAVNGSKILILGIAYKKDVNDTRGSPGLEILSMLAEKGALADYHDPYVPTIPLMRGLKLTGESLQLTERLLTDCDCVVVVTDHSNLDYDLIVQKAPLIVDTRNAFNKNLAKVVAA